MMKSTVQAITFLDRFHRNKSPSLKCESMEFTLFLSCGALLLCIALGQTQLQQQVGEVAGH